MALAGFGHGLVPIGVAHTLGAPRERLIELDRHGLNRPVRFVARKSMFSQPLVQSFHDSIVDHAARM